MAFYRRNWSEEYAALTDAVLIASDGTRFEVHSAVLKSPLVTDRVRPEIPLNASSSTIYSILPFAYHDNSQLARCDAPVHEVLEVLDHLGCVCILKGVCSKYCSFLELFKNAWTGSQSQELFEELPTTGDQSDHFVEICVAFLKFPCTGVNDDVLGAVGDVVIDVARALRALYKTDKGWATIISNPKWEGVSGSIMAKLFMAVTTEMDLALPTPTQEWTVTVPLLPSEFDEPFFKTVDLCSGWVVKCKHYSAMSDVCEAWVEYSGVTPYRCSRIEASCEAAGRGHLGIVNNIRFCSNKVAPGLSAEEGPQERVISYELDSSLNINFTITNLLY